MPYTSYTHYKNHFRGSKIPPEAFDNLEIQAAAYVNKITFGRITESTDVVQNAVCAVCDVMFVSGNHIGIKSESNDGYSVTYADESAMQKQMYQAAASFLPSELLYRGL